MLYPTSQKGALAKFGVGTIFPRPVNRKELNERAREEGEASLSPAERKYRGVFAERNAFFKEAKRLMPEALEDDKLPEPLRQAFNRKAQRFAEYARAEGKKDGDLTQRDRYAIDISLFVSWGLASREEARGALDWMRSASEEEVRDTRRRSHDSRGSARLVEAAQRLGEFAAEKSTGAVRDAARREEASGPGSTNDSSSLCDPIGNRSQATLGSMAGHVGRIWFVRPHPRLPESV